MYNVYIVTFKANTYYQQNKISILKFMVATHIFKKKNIST